MIFRKIQFRLKWLLHDFLAKLGVSFDNNRRKGEVQVICFHGVCRDEQEFINGRFLKESQLRIVLEEIKANFNVLSMDQFLTRSFDPNRLNVLLTFDDGYKNNQEILLPIIENLNLPVALFVTTNTHAFWMDLIDIFHAEKVPMDSIYSQFSITKKLSNAGFKKWMIEQSRETIEQITERLFQLAPPVLDRYTEFWKLLSEKELAELAGNPLIFIGNHSVGHGNYAGMTMLDIEEDIKSAASYLTRTVGGDGFTFAYPFGLYTQETTETLKALGYVQFIAEGNPKYQGECIDRLVVNPFISLRNQLIAIRNGKY